MNGKFQKFEIKEGERNLENFLAQEKEAYQNQMKALFEKINGEIPFTVSDMLRGKCMFREISQINQAAKEITENCRKKGFKVVEIENRLGKNTKDLVFKIEIGGIIAEFQLAYQFNVVKNEFNHKIFELCRSKFFTVVETLNVFNERGMDFMA